MGCKESKHKVAAGNTIITPSPSKRHSNIDIVGNNNKDVQKIPENAAKSDPGQKQESLKANGDSKARNSDESTSNVNIIAKERKNAKGDSRVDEKVKESEIVEDFDDKEIKKENVGESNKKNEGAVIVEEKAGKGNLVCEESPNNFFSSRKDDETIEGIISEGISGTSVYYTPHKEGASEDQSKKVLESAEEMKESVDQETKDDEIKTEEAAANVTEVTWVKKVEAAGLDEGNPLKDESLAEGNSVEKIEVVDVVVEVNSVKEVEVEAIEEDLVKEIKSTADRNEENSVLKEEAGGAADAPEEKVVNVAAEKPVKEVEFAGVTEGNPVIKENMVKEAEVIDTPKATIPVLKQEAAELIIVESKGANGVNVTETSEEEDSKTN